MSAKTAVVVLAGGEGRRMGGGKPLRPFGESTLVAHAVALARRWSPLAAVAVRDPAQVAGQVDAPVILDDPGISGPIAGLAAALAFARDQGAEQLLTIPCDAPRLPDDLLSRLEAALTGEACAAVPESGGNLHPDCALWRVEALERLPAYLATGKRSLRGFAESCGLARAEWPAEGEPFANANTPEVLEALQPAPAEPLRPRRRRLLYRALGWTAVALAAAGAILPLLPTTIFLLIALWAFARGSPEWADWLRANRRFGPYIRDWEERGAIPVRAKALAIVMMSASLAWLGWSTHNLLLTASVGVVLLAVAGFILTRPSA
jgi:molybdopterin-guanine dinucleotide biosynthesis protein A